jgi:hypothetical protein
MHCVYRTYTRNVAGHNLEEDDQNYYVVSKILQEDATISVEMSYMFIMQCLMSKKMFDTTHTLSSNCIVKLIKMMQKKIIRHRRKKLLNARKLRKCLHFFIYFAISKAY